MRKLPEFLATARAHSTYRELDLVNRMAFFYVMGGSENACWGMGNCEIARPIEQAGYFLVL
jgi:hypothetical protein